MVEISPEIIKRLTRRPALTAAPTDFWADSYVSAHVLHAHLNSEDDVGSRKPERIQAEAAWLDDRLRAALPAASCAETEKGEGRPLLLDLGCGPGLYAAAFAARGWFVHGIDFSPASIAYARKNSADRARYQLADFTRCSYPRADAAVLVYGIFGNLSDRDRDRMLARVRKSLVPGAPFVFDAFTEPFARREGGSEIWYSAPKDGFWMREAHVVLEQSHIYEEKRTVLKCYHLISASRGFETRIVRFRWYDRAELIEVLERNGFEVVETAGSLAGEPYHAEGNWIAVCARVRTDA